MLAKVRIGDGSRENGLMIKIEREKMGRGCEQFRVKVEVSMRKKLTTKIDDVICLPFRTSRSSRD